MSDVKIEIIFSGIPSYDNGKYYMNLSLINDEKYEVKEEDTIAVMLVDTQRVVWRGKATKETEEQWSIYFKDPSDQRQITVWGKVG